MWLEATQPVVVQNKRRKSTQKLRFSRLGTKLVTIGAAHIFESILLSSFIFCLKHVNIASNFFKNNQGKHLAVQVVGAQHGGVRGGELMEFIDWIELQLIVIRSDLADVLLRNFLTWIDEFRSKVLYCTVSIERKVGGVRGAHRGYFYKRACMLFRQLKVAGINDDPLALSSFITSDESFTFWFQTALRHINIHFNRSLAYTMLSSYL